MHQHFDSQHKRNTCASLLFIASGNGFFKHFLMHLVQHMGKFWMSALVLGWSKLHNRPLHNRPLLATQWHDAIPAKSISPLPSSSVLAMMRFNSSYEATGKPQEEGINRGYIYTEWVSQLTASTWIPICRKQACISLAETWLLLSSSNSLKMVQ